MTKRDKLSGNHQRRLLGTFEHLDELMEEVVRALDPSCCQSPFNKLISDAAPIQHKVMADYVAKVRAIMLQLLREHEVPLTSPTISAVWSARVALTTARVSVEELRPQAMRGYGELSPDASKHLNLTVAELDELLARMESYLAEGSARDLHARLQQLSGTARDVRLLRELERIITSRGLVEFRPTLDMLVERFESESFEIAVFGRVSSGKSSLLDYLLGIDILPVGVTPVTAIPTRVRYGANPRAVIWFAQGEPVTVAPGRLSEYVTERQNPANAKHVTRAMVELPAEQLRQGVTFVDTPGLGSLATSWTAESLAYLPRCDLGIVLVDASSTLTPDDIALFDMLHRAGADSLLLLSKADMLPPDDQQKALRYAREQLHQNLQVEIPAYLMSVHEEAALCEQWVADALTPRLEAHRRLAEESRHRKIGLLREKVVAVLRNRLQGTQSLTSLQLPTATPSVERWIAETLAYLDSAWRQFVEPPKAGLVKEVIDQIAQAQADNWRSKIKADRHAQDASGGVLNAAAIRLGAPVARFLVERRNSVAANLRRATGEDCESDLPRAANMPMFDPAAVAARIRIHKPVAAFLGRRILLHGLRSQLGSVEAEIQNALSEYVKQLEDWRVASMRELRRAFVSKVELLTSIERCDSDTNDNGFSKNDPSVKDDIEALSAARSIVQPGGGAGSGAASRPCR